MLSQGEPLLNRLLFLFCFKVLNLIAKFKTQIHLELQKQARLGICLIFLCVDFVKY